MGVRDGLTMMMSMGFPEARTIPVLEFIMSDCFAVWSSSFVREVDFVRHSRILQLTTSQRLSYSTCSDDLPIGGFIRLFKSEVSVVCRIHLLSGS